MVVDGQQGIHESESRGCTREYKAEMLKGGREAGRVGGGQRWEADERGREGRRVRVSRCK